MQGVFSEFAALLLISAAAGALSLWLRQPVLIAYIVVGIVAGPALLGLVRAHDQIDLLAQVGVAVLLLVVGLKLDLQHVRHIGPVALATGLDPEVARELRQQGLGVRFGDGTESDFIESLPLWRASWAVCTFPDFASNRALVHALREHKYRGEIAVIAREPLEDSAREQLGAPTVLYPMENAVDYAVSTLTRIIHRKEKSQ